MNEEQVLRMPDCERRHFAQCSSCYEWYDRRDVEQVVEHLGHQGLPTIMTLLETCPGCRGPMHFKEHPREMFVGVWMCHRCHAEKWTKNFPIHISREEFGHRLDELSNEWISLDG